MTRLALCLLAAATAMVAADTCDTVRSETSIDVQEPITLEYQEAQTEYWSTSCGALKPSCILEPTTTEEVAAIVRILGANNETFAIKSGGHNPNNYFSSVDGGPLISTKSLNEVILDRDTETARVGPGNRWDDVSAALDGTGFTAVGGRIGNVGVGGYMLGGGLSFMSAQYGWAASSVLEFTLVLANATTVKVTESNHPDLFKALRGGGSNYGIVTSYLLQVYPQGQVWGGNLFFHASNKTNAALLQATRDFTEYNTDEKAAVIVTAERTLATLVDLWIVFLYYNGPEVPAGVFDNFTAAEPFLNTGKTQSMNELVTGNNWALVRGSVYTIGTETTPLPDEERGPEVMGALYERWVSESNEAALVAGSIASIAFQPMPKQLVRRARERGGAAGDLIDFDDEVDRIIIELDYSFLLNTDYPKIDGVMQATYGGLAEVRDRYEAAGALPSGTYTPLFMNDGFYAQDYFGRLRPENAALAARVRDQVDPDGLWKLRTGGWKP